MKKSTDAYDVGYGKPPKDSQFQPGESGNRKGRPKGSKNTAAPFEEMLSEKITVREGNRTRRIPRIEAMLHAVMVKALKGDPRAFQTVMTLVKQSGMFEPEKQDERSQGGVLLIPEQMSVEEWRAAEKARLAKQADEQE